MRKLWSIPIVAIALYCLTILTQYGYLSHFGIPPSFIEVSLRDNIIFSYTLAEVFRSLVMLIHWWQWIIAIAIFAAVTFFGWGKGLLAIITVLCALFVYKAPQLGETWATNQTNFLVLSNCQNVGKGEYVIPQLSGGQAVLMPLDRANHKIGSNFMVKNLAETGCPVQKEELGKLFVSQ